MRILLSLACASAAALLGAAFPPAAAAQQLDYALSPYMEGGALRGLDFSLDFYGEPDGETDLELPVTTGAGDVITSLSAAGGELKRGPEERVRILRHRPNARIRLTWRVVDDWPEGPTGINADPYRPVIQAAYFQVLGPAVMIVPRGDGRTPARFTMRGFPGGWTLASDLEHPRLARADLRYSVIVGGDYRVLRGARDRNMRLAIRGAWTFQDEDLVRDLETIIDGQRRFWGDANAPFFVTLTQLPGAPNRTTSGGTGLEDGFAFYGTPNVVLRRLTRLLAHEGQHTWIPLQVGRMPDVGEAASYWFSEGFTDFYAPRILVRQGIWGAREFADDLNEMLRDYAASPERSAPNTRIVEARQKDWAVEHLPYLRGRLFATLIDAKLRARGRDLDDVMMEMRRRAPASDMLVSALFAAVMADTGLPVEEDIRRHIELGEPILLPEDTFAPCGVLVLRGVRQELVLDGSLEGARREACLRVLGGS
jgi:predicted metalloprotease with PDZ domain